ncbi:uncharacterized protein IUM83_14302 [Phytophthora cinnamomi]|uniref:uncharacterized protein n=1 Tax=Phytophthora cinnamomi TaxID=4785 RepID=UPI003559605A|nr:hypothetical protein IUM83_14302 [Phytophthora cinnamomi]
MNRTATTRSRSPRTTQAKEHGAPHFPRVERDCNEQVEGELSFELPESENQVLECSSDTNHVAENETPSVPKNAAEAREPSRIPILGDAVNCDKPDVTEDAAATMPNVLYESGMRFAIKETPKEPASKVECVDFRPPREEPGGNAAIASERSAVVNKTLTLKIDVSKTMDKW